MKTITSFIRQPIAAAMLLWPVAFVATALPIAAMAQPAAPEVRSLEVRTDGELRPGSRLRLRVEASPRGQAVVRVPGLDERIVLTEERPGIYIGRYVLKRGDLVREDRDLRVTVRYGNRTATARYPLAEVMGTPPVALRIERFGVAPIERVEPGADLRFVLSGAPGGQVTIDLPGVRNDVALREVRPGHYEGSYTLRRADNLRPNRPVVATLRVGERTVTAELSEPLVQARAEPRPPPVVTIPPAGLPLQVMNHADNEVVHGASTTVQGRTVPFATVQARVDASIRVPNGFAVAQQVYGQTLQADANGNFAFSFAPRFVLPGTRYDVSLAASKGGTNQESRLTLFQR